MHTNLLGVWVVKAMPGGRVDWACIRLPLQVGVLLPDGVWQRVGEVFGVSVCLAGALKHPTQLLLARLCT